MATGKIVLLYASTFAVFIVVDFVWLGAVARGFYRQQIGELMLERPNWAAAIVFYFFFVAGVLLFAVLPGLEAESFWRTVLFGALFGLIAYGTYDLTNLATLKGWTTTLVVVDMIWGTALAGVVSAAGYAIGRWLG